MSNYGPSGGPYRDQPHDPWQSHPPHEPYDPPADPWGPQHDPQDPWGGQPSSMPVGGPGSPVTADPGYPAGRGHTGYGYGQEPGYGYPQSPAAPHSPAGPRTPPGPPARPVWSQPVPPPRKKGLSVGLVALLGVVALLVFGGVGVGWMLLGDDDGGKQAGPATTPATSTSATPESTGDPSPASEDATPPTDARFAAKGQCLVNKGTNDKPVMEITKCARGTYEVLRRFDGTTDYNGRCGGGKVPGYEYFYFFDSELDTLDYVLCLKQR